LKSLIVFEGQHVIRVGPAAPPPAPPSGPPAASSYWINELHYDNVNKDADEFVEVAGPTGASLDGWSVIGYNGADGSPYSTKSLSGLILQGSGTVGVASVSFEGLQNGMPDGVALVNAGGAVMDFISYEGTVTGTSGPAQGAVSVDIGVAESETSRVRGSLGLNGPSKSSQWVVFEAATPGFLNPGQ
jgi:hypothetical protein